MKFKHILTTSLLSLGLAAARAQEVKLNVPGQATTPAPATAPGAPAATPAAPVYTDIQIIEELGWLIADQARLGDLEFSKGEIDTIIKGFSASVAGKEPPFDPEQIIPSVKDYMQKKQAVYAKKMEEKMRPQLEEMQKKNAEAAAAFFADLKEKKNVVQLPSGLRYEIVKTGEGAFPKANDTVVAHYTGTLLDGTVFDSSVQRGKPEEFALDQVIPGWTEGLQKVNKGGKIKLYVPANLGYGEYGNQSIPPG